MEFKVRPLVDLTFKALFEDIFSHLQSCHEQNKVENLMAILAVDDFAPVVSLHLKVTHIREKLDPFLIGSFSKFREKLIKEFTEGHLYSQIYQVDTAVCLAFIDCILDDSFKEWDASSHAVSTHFQDPSLLLNILALRSPKLESIKVRSQNTDSFPAQMTAQMSQSCILSLKNFTHLTSLSIEYWSTPYDSSDFFSQLSDSCPKLSKLNLGNFHFDVEQLFALMFGPKHNQLPMVLQPQYLKRSEIPLHKLEFQQESLTSICSSLKEFRCKDYCDLVQSKSQFWLDPSAIAFFLRHFRYLQKLNHSCLQCEAKVFPAIVNLLEEAAIDTTEELTSMMAFSSSQSAGVLQLTINAPFRGYLNLVEVEEVDINSRKIMLTLQLLCPNLKSIRFCQNNPVEEADQSNVFSIDDLKSMLAVESNCWSKINVVKFDDVSAAYRQAVLSVIGSQLLELCFFNCDDIDGAAELFPCTKLKRLFINCGSTVAPISTESPISAENFLPELKNLFLTSCSPGLQRLFETPRPSLTEIYFNCAHFGIREASSCHWADLPHLWPNLESFSIDVPSRSLESIEDLRQIRSAIRKLKNIRKLYFPNDLEELASDEVRAFLQELETELKAFQPKFVFFCSSQGADDICMYP